MSPASSRRRAGTAVRTLRAWWHDRWTDVCMGGFYAVSALVGAFGFRDPSVTLEATLGVGSLVYTIGMLLFGVLGVASVLANSRNSESVCLIAISVLSVLAGLLLTTAPEGAGVQTGLRLIASPLGAVVLAWYRRQIGLTRRDIDAQLAANEALRTRLSEGT